IFVIKCFTFQHAPWQQSMALYMIYMPTNFYMIKVLSIVKKDSLRQLHEIIGINYIESAK
ncbi:hypothetical protein ACJX0J_015021, partial [Zea mays]